MEKREDMHNLKQMGEKSSYLKGMARKVCGPLEPKFGRKLNIFESHHYSAASKLLEIP